MFPHGIKLPCSPLFDAKQLFHKVASRNRTWNVSIILQSFFDALLHRECQKKTIVSLVTRVWVLCRPLQQQIIKLTTCYQYICITFGSVSSFKSMVNILKLLFVNKTHFFNAFILNYWRFIKRSLVLSWWAGVLPTQNFVRMILTMTLKLMFLFVLVM